MKRGQLLLKNRKGLSIQMNNAGTRIESPLREFSDQLRHELGQPPIQEDRNARRKWLTASEPNRYIGWTVVANVPMGDPFMDTAVKVLDSIRSDYQAGEWSIHPLTSLHMTVFSGQTQYDFEKTGINLREGLDRATDAVSGLVFPDVPLVVEATDFARWDENLSLTVVPATAELAEALAEFRDTIAEKTGFRRANHDDVRYHITFAYRLTPEDQGTQVNQDEMLKPFLEEIQALGPIRLERPIFSIFDSMVSFPPTRNM
ncbi:DUF1868 domain-containing protein [Corynebacterium amycolatum]|uniref:DUF1868 domain-containing protein n=2 Tax=Corynebacteriaceae TaxID=1653 RepID=UPI00288333E5|nr:DUF1868 domain-containing protein [Corynebacterium amycolatum]